MPKNKKIAPFMVFVKEKYPNLPLNIAIEKAGKDWEKLSSEQKFKYKGISTTSETKLSCHGVSISEIDRDNTEAQQNQDEKKKYIDDLINTLINRGELETYTFNMVNINYFSYENVQNLYTPAEIGISLYSLKEGILNTYHSLINPGFVPYGLCYETKLLSENSHQLGIPPQVNGEENLAKLYANIFDFITENNAGTELQPLFTLNEDIKVVESALEFLKPTSSNSILSEIKLRILPLEYLLFVIKMSTANKNSTLQPNFSVINSYIQCDRYEYEPGISCTFHEEKDLSKFCSLARVVRWCYMISENVCDDLALNMKPGCHIPASNNK